MLILGAGPAGSATALALLAAGVERVLLLDRDLARPFAIGESATPDVAQHLQRLGLACDLGALGHMPYYANCSLWGGGAPVLDHFIRRGHSHGWHLDRAAFDRWLRQEAAARGAHVLAPASVDALAPAGAGWQVTLAGADMGAGVARQVSARVLVDASGRRAALATRLGAQQQRLDTLVALAVHANAAGDALNGLSLVEPFADGWWYATCVPDGRAVVTLMTDHDIARDKNYYQPEAYLAAWRATQELAARVPAPAQLPPSPAIQAFAAHSSFINRAAGRNWLAVGDALLAFDPLTSSGIAGALGDAPGAAAVILAQLAGDIAPAKAWAERANRSFTRYLQGLRQHYGHERRWPQEPFWARRQQAV